MNFLTIWKKNMKKICNKCNIEKDLSEFHKNITTKDGLQYYCKKCIKIITFKSKRNWNLKNKEKISDYLKTYSKKYRKINGKRLNFNKQKYNITFEQKEQMIIDQNGKCKICGNKFKNSKDMHVDHCHKTNKVRGILCFNCNNGLGQFKDDNMLLLKAFSYKMNN